MSSTSGLEVAPRREGPAAEGVDERRGQRPGKRVRSGELDGVGEGSAAAAHQQGGRADREASVEGDGSQRAGTWEGTPELLLAMGLKGADEERGGGGAFPGEAMPVQRKAMPMPSWTSEQVQARGELGDDHVAAIAAHGVASASSALPHQEAIQRSFGSHDISGIRAQVGGEAASASDAIGAQAYATGNRVAFAQAPDLHTAAHEAAHVVQQAHGVSLYGGVGQAGDSYERHADEVADRVVAGQSAAPLLERYESGSRATNAAVQRQDKDKDKDATQPTEPVGASGAAVDPPAEGDSKPGFIDHSEGANIRTRPAELAGSLTLTPTPLPPATRVFVSGRHPQTAEWSYVTAFLPGSIVRGYVQGFRVTTDLPEPMAKLYQVQPGDTAEGLAVQEFSSAVRDGHDLRYYENVLLHVNRERGRAGVTGSFQDPGLLGGGANNVQLVAGHRIWLVSPTYAHALEGVVPDGSLTNGAYAKVKRFVQHIEDIVQSVTESRNHFGEVAGEYAQAIRDHMPEIIGIIAGFIVAEAASAFLAASPTGVGQIAAVVIQLGLAVFGAAGMVQAGIQALEHAERWLTLAWTAKGKEAQIAAASKEFLKMLVSLAMAALAYVGVKGNMGKAAAITDSMPTMMPAFAVAGGGQMGGASAGTAVAAGIPTPFGPFGTAMAMSSDKDGEGGGSSDKEPAGKDVAGAGSGPKATIRERLAEYYQRLLAKPKAKNAEEGLRQVRGTLDEVEDQLSGVVKKDPPPPPNMSDGRMYPPLDDFVVRHPDGRITATTRGHKIEIGADGEVVIRNKKTGDIELRKP
jgi:Domain of unknown function (DUF4157)